MTASPEQRGADTQVFDELVDELDEEIAGAGRRGNVLPRRAERWHRSTRRRQDAPPLPKRNPDPRTIGKTAPDGKTFRPSLFVTLTYPCDDLPKLGARDGAADRDVYVRR